MVTAAESLSGLRDVCAEPYGVWLDSSMASLPLGSRSFWASHPVAVLRSRGRLLEVDRRSVTERFEGDPFEVLREMLAEHTRNPHGAAVGYLGYGLKRHIESLPDTVVDDLELPECHMAFYERLHEVDPFPLRPAEPSGPGRRFPELRSTFTRPEYEAAVRRALEYIRAGDIYQVNLSQRFEVPRPGDPFDVYLRLRSLSPAPFAAFLRFPDCAVLSSSPERFLRYTPEDRRIETRPIKGTRPRSATSEEDEAFRRELLASEKDRAENLMIVDLERNDLGRVAEIGSVRVTRLFEPERYATVHHLVSTVEAHLAGGRDVVDLLRAAFPGGSITGAPKIRSMEIIDELEPVARGVYTGSIGYIRPDGELDLNIAIRTVVVKDRRAYFSVGGGIVADSDPAAEYHETLDKGAAIARALLGEAGWL